MKHLKFKDGKRTPAGTAWQNMKMRCTSASYQKKRPTYVGCKVSEPWLDFQVFAEWYNKQPNDGTYQLDKDILVENNKIYSPETCALVPRQINQAMVCRANLSGLKTGTQLTPKGRYSARHRVFDVEQHIGVYDTEEEAHKAYLEARKEHLKVLACSYPILDIRVFNKLMEL